MAAQKAAARSAGLLLWRRTPDGPEVLIAHMGGPYWAGKDEHAWSIPKGEYEPGESPLDAARREFTEELGSPPPAGEAIALGEAKQRNGKIVTAWAIEGDFDADSAVSNTFELEWPPRSGRVQHFPEIDRAAWMPIDLARTKLVSAQTTFLDRGPWHPAPMSLEPPVHPGPSMPLGLPPLGLPDSIRACLFDLDGVLTDTAAVHRAAWKATFDPVLAAHGQSEFTDADYAEYVDGKPRLDGVRDFLGSRDIEVPDGADDDPTDAETVNGIGNRKNEDLLRRIKQDGVRVFEGSRRYLQAAADAGLRRVVVSSSANTADVLKVTGLAEFVEHRVDGVTIRETGMPGKPAPDSFLAGARIVEVSPAEAAVFEDATAGVQAGRKGAFGFVIGVNRIDDEHADALRRHGADIVVGDLGDLL